MDARGFSFPLLKAKQILDCLQDLQIPLTEEALTMPERHRESIMRVFERLVEATTGTTREEMAQPVFAGLNVLNYAELHEDSIPELAFYRACAKMMRVSCVNDFSQQDLTRPNKQRIRKLLSAVINFCKFREERLVLYNEITAKKEKALHHMSSLQTEAARLSKELEALKEQTKEDRSSIAAVERDCRAVEGIIADKNRGQAEIRQQSSDFKKRSNDLKDRNATLSLDIQTCLVERERLQGQIVNSPVRIRREMVDQQAALERERAEGLQAEKEALKMDMSVSIAAVAEQETLAAVQTIEEVETELSKQKDAIQEVKATQSTVSANRSRSAEEEARVHNSERQLHRLEEKVQHIRRQARVKAEAAAVEMKDIQAELREAEHGRRAMLHRLDSAEADKLRHEQMLTEARRAASEEQEEYLSRFRQMESAVLQHQRALLTAVRSVSVHSTGSGVGGR